MLRCKTQVVFCFNVHLKSYTYLKLFDKGGQDISLPDGQVTTAFGGASIGLISLITKFKTS